MKLTEKIIALLIIIALILKLMLVLGGVVMLVFLMTALAAIYFVFGFALFNRIRLRNIFKKASYAGISTLRIIGSVLMGLALSAAVDAIMFKLMMWPGAGPMLIAGLTPVFIVFVIVGAKFMTTQDRFYKDALIRTGIASVLVIAMIFIPSIAIIRFEYRKYPGYIQAFEEYNRNPHDPAARKNVDIEQAKTWMSAEELEMYEKTYDASHAFDR